MIRLLLYLLGKNTYEPCKSCETLKQQLELVNGEKKELTATLLGLIKPKVYEAAPVEVNPLQQNLSTFSRRRAALIAKDREAARTLSNSTYVGKPDRQPNQVSESIARLEKELGVEEDIEETPEEAGLKSDSSKG